MFIYAIPVQPTKRIGIAAQRLDWQVGLRCLQARRELDKLLNGLAAARQDEEARIAKKIPILERLSPDLSNNELEDALDAIIANGIDGVVATNTTTSRKDVETKFSSEVGGLSGTL